MSVEEGLSYTKEHEWIRLEDDIASVGITNHAQKQLGDIVYVQLPQPGNLIKKDEVFGVVESVKAVSDIFAPLNGQIIEVNNAIIDAPQLLNSDPYVDGWMLKIKIDDNLAVSKLMNYGQYVNFLQEISK